MKHAIHTTIDRAGRVVIPKAIREGAGLEPGERLVVSLRDGRVEIAPAPRTVRMLEKGLVRVAVADEERGTLSSETVNTTRDDVRGRPV